MSKENMDCKQHHVIIFLVNRCLGWLSNTAMEQEMGEECKRKGR